MHSPLAYASVAELSGCHPCLLAEDMCEMTLRTIAQLLPDIGQRKRTMLKQQLRLGYLLTPDEAGDRFPGLPFVHSGKVAPAAMEYFSEVADRKRLVEVLSNIRTASPDQRRKTAILFMGHVIRTLKKHLLV